ncbi:MAG TPA: hypothetical protein VMU90_04200 [Solirubrobacteraceae bacterium]|nr:hypothetical protein [Solirubrobacteraceae bacterium]
MSQGQLIAGAAGVLLFVSLFFHWGGGQNAWDAFSFVEIWLLLTALAAVAWGLLPAFGVELALPAESGYIVAGLGMAALGWSFGLETEVSGAIGVWLAIIAGLGIAFGGFSAVRAPASPAPRRRTAPPPPSPPPAGGAPPSGPPTP